MANCIHGKRIFLQPDGLYPDPCGCPPETPLSELERLHALARAKAAEARAKKTARESSMSAAVLRSKIKIEVSVFEWMTKAISLAREVQRGCDCEYDYRCSNCSNIVRLHDHLKVSPI